MTIRDPFAAPFERIAKAYKLIMDYLGSSGFREKPHDGVIPCFEHVREENGEVLMDVYIHTEGVAKGSVFTSFS